jgi:Ni/Co efflux regulator RcnB
MKRLIIALTSLSLLGSTAAMAADHPYQDNHAYTHRAAVQHNDWRRGERIPDEWRHGHQVNYRAYHLRKPPRGDYWVHAGSQFVLVGPAGVIIDFGR